MPSPATAPVATTTKPKTEPALSLTALREALKPEPVLSTKFTLKLSRAEHQQLQLISGAAGCSAAHCLRRLLALAAEALLADQEAA